jgi:hypothetical protein
MMKKRLNLEAVSKNHNGLFDTSIISPHLVAMLLKINQTYAVAA